MENLRYLFSFNVSVSGFGEMKKLLPVSGSMISASACHFDA